MHAIPRAQRICRSRKKGARLPEGAIYIGRPTIWGNPFMGRWGHARSVILHREWLRGRIGALTLEQNMHFCPAEIDALDRLRGRVLTSLHRLAGHDLACWCPLSSEWCHGETLLDMAASYAALESVAA